MVYSVETTVVAEQLLVAARQRTSTRRVSSEIQRLLDAPWAFIRQHPELRRGGHNVAVYWNAQAEGSVEVGVQVVARFDATDQVVCSATPAGTAATAAHFGPYSALGAAHDAVLAWCKRAGHRLAGPCWEVYGDWEDDPAKLRTDVFYLLA